MRFYLLHFHNKEMNTSIENNNIRMKNDMNGVWSLLIRNNPKSFRKVFFLRKFVKIFIFFSEIKKNIQNSLKKN